LSAVRAASFGFLVGLLGLAAMPFSAVAASDGAALYKTYCSQCHGMQGNGKGVNVRDMSVQPRDHTDPKEMGTRSDADLFKAIKEGGQAISKSVLMPPWGAVLSDDEIHALVTYLRQLCQCSHGGAQ
jgi:mono/diheme cytochrome c family protein